jgi:hypothetical protein
MSVKTTWTSWSNINPQRLNRLRSSRRCLRQTSRFPTARRVHPSPMQSNLFDTDLPRIRPPLDPNLLGRSIPTSTGGRPLFRRSCLSRCAASSRPKGSSRTSDTSPGSDRQTPPGRCSSVSRWHHCKSVTGWRPSQRHMSRGRTTRSRLRPVEVVHGRQQDFRRAEPQRRRTSVLARGDG